MIPREGSLWLVILHNLLTSYLCKVYRLNTYPLIHIGFIHAFLNTLAVAPLLERFEADNGTLLTAAMFFGRMHAHIFSEFETLKLNRVHSALDPPRRFLPPDRAWNIERK